MGAFAHMAAGPEGPAEPLARYTPAIWHGLTPVVAAIGEVGLSLQTADGVLRFRLPVASAAQLADALEGQRLTNVQADSSLGSPARDVSNPLEGRKV